MNIQFLKPGVLDSTFTARCVW